MNTRKSFFKGFFLSALITLAAVSCKKDTGSEPPPLPPTTTTGTLLTYTTISSSEFDKIDVLVDGKVMGSITAPYTSRPNCGDAASPSNTAIKLSPGKHTVSAIQYKGGEKVGEWDADDETIKEGHCTRVHWVD